MTIGSPNQRNAASASLDSNGRKMSRLSQLRLAPITIPHSTTRANSALNFSASSLLLLFLAATTVGCGVRRNDAPPAGRFAFAEKISIPGISDFGKVNDFLYRGAQPKE